MASIPEYSSLLMQTKPVSPSTASTSEGKIFDSWYSRMGSLISELGCHVSILETKLNNLYVELNKEDSLSKSPIEQTDFSPTCFYECLVKIEKDLAFMINKLSKIESTLNKII